MSTLRKLVFGVLLSQFIILSYASQNFYAGAGFLDSSNDFDLTITNYVTDNEVHSNPSENQVLWNLFLGYGATIKNNFYLGGELGTNFPDRSATVMRPGVTLNTETFTNTMKVQDYVTGDILPGFQVNQALLVYGRVGLSYDKLSLSQPLLPGNSPGTDFDTTDRKWGDRFGLGVRYLLTNHIGLGADYIYETYEPLTYNISQYDAKFKLKIHSNLAGLSAYYLF